MNFSDLFKQTNLICEFSPNGKYMANIVQYRLIIRDVNTLEAINIYSCLDTIQYIEWSPDSDFILCSLGKRNLIQVFSIENPEWKCKIDEGSAGLLQASWSPDSRHILTTSEFYLRITIWSLMNKSVSYMKHPKQIAKCYEFTLDGKYMLLAERRDCKDHVSIFATDNWQLLKHFEVDTDDLAAISWSPSGVTFCVLESPLEYKVLLYNIDGQCINKFQPSKCTLGAKCASWSPSGQLLAVGGYDQKLRLLNHITYRMIMEFEHPMKISSTNLVIFKEVDGRRDLSQAVIDNPNDEIASIFSTPSKYEVFGGTMQIASIKPDFDKPNPKVGISSIQFSSDNRYMFTKNDTTPNILWIWDMTKFKLSYILIQINPIKCAAWDPKQARLALCTGNNKIYMWSQLGCISVETPCEATFTIHSIRWNVDGNSIALIGKDQFCLTYLEVQNDELNTNRDEDKDFD